MSTRAKATKSKESTSASSSALSADQLRRKAKFQLLGSAVLVAFGVVLFALLLDSPPRPNTNEVSILIPARDSLAPLSLTSSAPAVAVAPAVAAPAANPIPAAVTSNPAPSAKAASTAQPASPASAPKLVAPANAASTTASSARPPAAPAKAIELAATAASSAASDAKKPSADAVVARYVVQVGAFTDPQKIRDVRAKLERAGFKTYAQVVQTTEGQRTRVRAGPFATKAEADKAAAKIKSLDLPAALLTL